MKRVHFFLFVAAVASSPVMGQNNSISLSIWQNGNELGRYAVNSIDSITCLEGEGKLAVWDAEHGNDTIESSAVDSMKIVYPEFEGTNTKSDSELKTIFSQTKISGTPFKKTGNHNPLMGHKFGADPFGMEYEGRLYIYMTDDHMYDSNGKFIDGGYGDIRNISIISSADLVNWTDHGAQPIAGSSGVAKWASNSWAPCAAHKTIDGKEKFFLYFADNGGGVGVVTSDTPYGPWKDPLGHALISRSTPNCSGSAVPWLFDPAVLIDDDSIAYLYFGGGTDKLTPSDPGSARCVQLGDDMISIVGEPVEIRPPYLFEDSGINKVGGKYLYSYCSNWTSNSNPGVAKIAYMTSDKPLGPFTYVGAFFDNPGDAGWAGGGGNNHHAVIKFKDKYYILYHTRTLKAAMRKSDAWKDIITDNAELRSTCMSELSVDEENGKFNYLRASATSEAGIEQIGTFNPYVKNEGETMAWCKDVHTLYSVGKYVKKITVTAEVEKPGGWIALSDVDFRNGANGFTARVKGKGIMRISTKKSVTSATTSVLAYVEIPDTGDYTVVTVPLMKTPVGKLQLYFHFTEACSLDYWSFF
ncbi:MAG: family 43 glycosylhydrolase [Bacteroidaceae bacterium]|nr:family 43 glycosylhydrolase [Bacteroidaceae bacterium]